MSVSSSKSSTVTRPRFCSKKCVRVESCENGDTVLVIWNQKLCRYTIVQESTFIHFLAEDSHPLFSLPVPSTKDILFENIEKPDFFFGTVTEKQYCMVKKEGTRYRVPIGTKFCRIKVKPLSTSSRHSVSSDHERSSKKNSKCKSISMDGQGTNTQKVNTYIFIFQANHLHRIELICRSPIRRVFK